MSYLLAAFILIWLVLFAYLFILSGRQRRLRRDIDELVRDTKNRSAELERAP